MFAPPANSPSGTEPVFGRIAIDKIEPECYQSILHAWQEQRGDLAYPAAEKIDPFLIPVLVPNLILYEVRDGNLTFRVVGEKVVTTAGTNLKGLTLTEAFGDTPYIRMVESQLRECAACGVPLYSNHDFQLAESTSGATRHTRKAWRIALPYGEPGPCGEPGHVTRLLCYQLFSREIEPPFRKDIDFDALLPQTVFKIEV